LGGGVCCRGKKDATISKRKKIHFHFEILILSKQPTVPELKKQKGEPKDGNLLSTKGNPSYCF